MKGQSHRGKTALRLVPLILDALAKAYSLHSYPCRADRTCPRRDPERFQGEKIEFWWEGTANGAIPTRKSSRGP